MNYISQLRGFAAARDQRPIGANAILLYFILLERANAAYFPKQLCLSNSTLQGSSGLSETSLIRARNELAQKGYIIYKKGARGQAPKYEIISLENSIPKFDGQTCGYSDDNSGTKGKPTESFGGGIYKQNNTKQNNFYNTRTRERKKPKNKFDNYEDANRSGYAELEKQIFDEILAE